MKMKMNMKMNMNMSMKMNMKMKMKMNMNMNMKTKNGNEKEKERMRKNVGSMKTRGVCIVRYEYARSFVSTRWKTREQKSRVDIVRHCNR